MFRKKLKSIYLNKDIKKKPFRDELLNIEQLGEYARILAEYQHIGYGTPNNYLRERLNDNEIILQNYNNEVLSVSKTHYISPATEWLIDNFYLIEEHIQLARHHFPKSYSKELPSFTDGPHKGLPRIYGIAVEYISHVDAQIDQESLVAFFKSYQEIAILKLGELWAAPIMLRLILIENLRRIVIRLQQDQKDRDLANEWMDKVEKANIQNSTSLLEVVSGIAKSDIPLTSAFVSEFSKRLSSQNPSLGIVKNWFDQKLQDEGLSVEELIHIENQHQAADQVSVSHSIKSLRFINSTDWKDFVEEISIVEKILRSEPAKVYGKMDFTSRDHYRHTIERMAQQSPKTEEEVAREVVRLATTAYKQDNTTRTGHIGYYLTDNGLQQLKERVGVRKTFRSSILTILRRYPLTFYAGSIVLISFLLTWLFSDIMRSETQFFTGAIRLVGEICFFIFISQLAVFLVNYIAIFLARPDFLPRLDFKEGIPSGCRTVIAIPTMISNKTGIDKLISDLEIHHLSNQDSSIRYALLTDFTDAGQETEPGDETLTDYIRTKTEQLNKKYPSDNNTLFYLFHRPRKWNPKEGKWMGYERKRGKLMAFNKFLTEGITAPFSVIEGNPDNLKGIKYVITLDTDTQLPPYSVHKLVGTMEHILNRPVIDPVRNIVVKGYGILQPRTAINLPSSLSSRFARLFTNEVGIDPYTRAISNVYQDVFHEGSFVGKGIYDVEIFEKVLADRFPENRILSHDLLESTYTRSGLIGDVEIYESYPSSYITDTKRQHRWMRGDWQIAKWFFPRVPLLTGSQSNPLSGVSKWKISDNIRRALVSPVGVLLLLLCCIFLPNAVPALWLLFLAAFLLPFIISFPVVLFRKPKEEPLILHIKEVSHKGFHQIKQILFNMMTFPHNAWMCMDAIVRSLWRLTVSHKHLLQWQTAEEADRTTENTLSFFYRQMWFSPVLGLICLVLVRNYPLAFLSTLPFTIAWLIAPFVAWFISLPFHKKEAVLSEEQHTFLYKIARKTWYFFETFVNETESWLPPDNYQEIPEPVVAARTSPTNIGLYLLANLSAYDMGYLSVKGLAGRLNKTFLTLNKLKKFRGHFYNWYDTRTLEPLYPLYISTVDSGNLAGHLITLAQGLKELKQDPVYNPVLFKGLLDTVRVMRDLSPENNQLSELENRLAGSSLPDTLSGAYMLLKEIHTQAGLLTQSFAPKEENMRGWGKTLQDNCRDHIENIQSLFPWIEKENRPEINWTNLSLEELAGYEKADILPEEIKQSIAEAKERIKIFEVLALQCEQLSQMDFKFLYEEKKDLFTIGYNVIDQRFDSSSYDMLASEARLCSYLAVASGQVPIEHWFSMGRLVILSKGKPVLLSWSGSMFEYLMPLLVMPDFEETLLHTTYQGVIEEQIEYGNTYHIPWGVSESGYNRPDTQFNYQYKAFGIPSLGLKRGLSKDIVIAPYATMLAVMVDPLQACKNLQRLSHEGQEGNYGYYEAIDYTPSHLPINEKNVTICSFMAHHQGMGLLALVNYMKENTMQKRFMACPQMKAFELLLQEKVPHSITSNVITDNSKLEIENLHAFHSNNVEITRNYTYTVKTPEINLLSNGRYQLMLNTAGAGYSRWNNLAVNRWRQDPTTDTNGLFIYMRDLNSGRYWSAGYQPALSPTKEYDVNFTQAYAEYNQRHSGLDINTSICVSPEDDVELRCVHITNHTHRNRLIELTTYSEVVIAPQGADEAHPVFSNLFVQTRYDRANSALFCTRRPRSEDEKPPYLFHLMIPEHMDDSKVTFETDRLKFIGRGNTLAAPWAMTSQSPLQGTEGAVLDPIISLRRTVTIPPGKTVRVCIIVGMAPTEETAFELVEKYQNIRMTDRAFDLAWTHSQVVLYNLNIREAEAQLFQRLAGAMIYMNPALRADNAILKNNKKGQNSLWAYGISGDVPLVLLRISKQGGLELVRQLILAHAYWRMKGLTVEMLILNEDISVYRQPLHDEIINLILTGVESTQLDKPGGIVVRPIDQIPGEDLILLQSAAKAIFSDLQGTLAEQVNRDSLYTQPLLLKPEKSPLPQENIKLSPRDLIFNNNLGGFTRDGKEYIITLYPGKNTPAPWSNVIANPTFGTVISESGSSYTWFENAHEFRLTPWYNDPVKETTGEAIYIRDEETGQHWSPTPLPVRGATPYTIRHGFGYTVFEHTENGIRSELCVYVAIDASVKCSVIKLHNLSGRPRNLSVTGYCEWVLGDTRTRNMLYVTTRIDITTGTLFARNHYNTDFSGKIAFLDIGTCRRVTGDRKEFIGENRTLHSPLAMERKHLSGKTGAGSDPCGAVQTMIELQTGEKAELRLLLGCAQSEDDMRGMVNRFRQPSESAKALTKVQQYWSRITDTIQVETPDPAADIMANGWLLYQTLSCRIWARSGYYQSGGAYGFRDQLQDVMALTYAEPSIMREQILRAARHQFAKGDVQHWWHPPMNRGVRTMFSDDYLWLPYVTHRYITTVGDTGILDEILPFLEGRELHPGEESYYDMPLISDETGSLYEHCVRSIRYGLKFGAHGLPLIGCGDWNDGMNLIGIEGKGESVWLAFFLYDVLTKFSEIATLYGDNRFAAYCTEQAAQLKENIHTHAWDGNWYRRAYFDDGTPLGSIQNPECRIDTLPQSWSVISGGGEPERSRIAMEQVNQQLVDRNLNIIRLFTPAFDKFRPSPGYIQGYVPGVRENGGQYTHGVIWTAIAFAMMGEADRAWELFDLLNPIHHGNNEQKISTYKTEPYVVAADIYSAVQHPGRGGWTWYTGSSAWLYRLLVETLLGINRRGDKLKLTPLMRKEWEQYTVTYLYYDTKYRITFRRRKENQEKEINNTIHLINDGQTHHIEYWV